MEQLCIKENDRKYSQTNNTVAMRRPLCDLLGRFGDTTFCKDILNGTAAIPNNLPQYTKEFLLCLQKDTDTELGELKLHMSTEDF